MLVCVCTRFDLIGLSIINVLNTDALKLSRIYS